MGNPSGGAFCRDDFFCCADIRYVPQYTTSATFVVSYRNSSASYSSLGTANTMATTFQKIVESSAMQDILCKKLGVDAVEADIQASVAEGTNLLDLRVTADNPRDSFDIMEGILENYSDITLYTGRRYYAEYSAESFRAVFTC